MQVKKLVDSKKADQRPKQAVKELKLDFFADAKKINDSEKQDYSSKSKLSEEAANLQTGSGTSNTSAFRSPEGINIRFGTSGSEDKIPSQLNSQSQLNS